MVPTHQFHSQLWPKWKNTILRTGFGFCIISTIISLIILIYLYSIPFRMRWRYDALISEAPRLAHNPYLQSFETPQPDIIPPQNFPVDTIYPDPMGVSIFEKDLTKGTNGIQLQNRQDAPFMLPSEPMLFEGLLKPHNVAIQPLPPTPLGYKYFSIRRIHITLPQYWHDDVRGNRMIHQTLMTCFSDWFPYDLIKEQEEEHLAWAAKQPTYRDPGHMKHIWGDLAQEEIEHNIRFPVNMSRIDKDLLAQYYGYDKYDDMPYHPRIPTDKSKLPPFKTTYPSNSNKTAEWVHRCVTPWIEDKNITVTQKPGYYTLFKYKSRAEVWTGSEDSRIYYDRCGRLKLNFGVYNDETPIAPIWGTKVVDVRKLDSRLEFATNEFCPTGRYLVPQLSHLIDDAYDGHAMDWEKNVLELQYGYGQSDISNVIQTISDFEEYAIVKDYKTNTLMFDQSAYKELKQARSPTPYFDQNHTYLHHAFPMTVINSTNVLLERDSKIQLKDCLKRYSVDRQYELGINLWMDEYHSATTLYLLKINQEDYDHVKPEQPNVKPSKTPMDRPQWVYIAIGHDRTKYNEEDPKSKKDRNHKVYRPVMTIFNAITLELIAVRPIDFTTPTKCRDGAPTHCLTGGLGTDCYRYCYFTYVHSLFPIETPLSFTVVEDDRVFEQSTMNHIGEEIDPEVYQTLQNNYIKLNPDITRSQHGEFPRNISRSLHTVLPMYHTLDTQFFAGINIDDEHTWLQELDLRAIWYHRYTCPKDTMTGLSRMEHTDRSEVDPVELKFIWQQTPRMIFPFLPDWAFGGKYKHIPEFYDWISFYEFVAPAFKWFFLLSIATIAYFIVLIYPMGTNQNDEFTTQSLPGTPSFEISSTLQQQPAKQKYSRLRDDLNPDETNSDSDADLLTNEDEFDINK